MKYIIINIICYQTKHKIYNNVVESYLLIPSYIFNILINLNQISIT